VAPGGGKEERVPGHIPWRKVDLSLRALRSIWISTTRPDGRPHSVPVWFTWDDGRMYFLAKQDTQKAKNLAGQPWAVLHAGDGDDVSILEGPVTVISDPDELARREVQYREKYVDPHSGARATIYGANAAVYCVRVRHVMAWEYGVVSTRTDWWLNSEESPAE